MEALEYFYNITSFDINTNGVAELYLGNALYSKVEIGAPQIHELILHATSNTLEISGEFNIASTVDVVRLVGEGEVRLSNIKFLSLGKLIIEAPSVHIGNTLNPINVTVESSTFNITQAGLHTLNFTSKTALLNVVTAYLLYGKGNDVSFYGDNKIGSNVTLDIKNVTELTNATKIGGKYIDIKSWAWANLGMLYGENDINLNITNQTLGLGSFTGNGSITIESASALHINQLIYAKQQVQIYSKNKISINSTITSQTEGVSIKGASSVIFKNSLISGNSSVVIEMSEGHIWNECGKIESQSGSVYLQAAKMIVNKGEILFANDSEIIGINIVNYGLLSTFNDKDDSESLLKLQVQLFILNGGKIHVAKAVLTGSKIFLSGNDGTYLIYDKIRFPVVRGEVLARSDITIAANFEIQINQLISSNKAITFYSDKLLIEAGGEVFAKGAIAYFAQHPNKGGEVTINGKIRSETEINILPNYIADEQTPNTVYVSFTDSVTLDGGEITAPIVLLDANKLKLHGKLGVTENCVLQGDILGLENQNIKSKNIRLLFKGEESKEVDLPGLIADDSITLLTTKISLRNTKIIKAKNFNVTLIATGQWLPFEECKTFHGTIFTNDGIIEIGDHASLEGTLGTFINTQSMQARQLSIELAEFKNLGFLRVSDVVRIPTLGRLDLAENSITQFGYLEAGTSSQGFGELGFQVFACKSCTFSLTTPHANSFIIVNKFVVYTEDVPKYTKPGLRESFCDRWYVRTEYDTFFFIELDRTYMYDSGCARAETEALDAYIPGKFIVSGNLKLDVREQFNLFLAQFIVRGQFYPIITEAVHNTVVTKKYATSDSDLLTHHGWRYIASQLKMDNYQSECWEQTYYHPNTHKEKVCGITSVVSVLKSNIAAGSWHPNSKIDRYVYDISSNLPSTANPDNPYLGNLNNAIAKASQMSNALVTIPEVVLPKIDKGTLQIHFGVNEIIPQQFFKYDGLDLKFLANYQNFLNSKIWVFTPLLSNNLLPAPGEDYILHYYIRLAFNVQANFDPYFFLKQLHFKATGVVFTIDGHYLEYLLQDAEFLTIGRLSGYDSNRLANTLAENAYNEQQKLGLVPGVSLTRSQIASLSIPIVWPVWSDNCVGKVVDRCLSYKLYFNDESLADFLYGANIIADEDIHLDIKNDLILSPFHNIKSVHGAVNVNIGGDAVLAGEVSGHSVKVSATGNIFVLNKIYSEDSTYIAALNAAIIGEMKAGHDITVETIYKLVVASLKSSESTYYSNAKRQGYSKTESWISKDATLGAGGKIDIVAGSDLEIIGASVIGSSVYLSTKSGKVSVYPIELYASATEWGRRFCNSYEALKYHRSQIEGKGGLTSTVSIVSGSGILLVAPSIKGGGDGVLSAQGSITAENPNEYVSIVKKTTVKKWFSRETRTESNFVSQTAGSVLNFVGDLFVKSADDQKWIGAQIKAHSVTMLAGSPEHGATVALLPGYREARWEVKVEKSGLILDAGLYIGKHEEKRVVNSRGVLPTIIEIVGGDDTSQFIGYSGGKWLQLSSMIVGREGGGDGGGINKKSKISIQAKNVVLEAAPDVEFQYAYVRKDGFGIGVRADGSEVSVSLGSYGSEKASKGVLQVHNKRSGLVGGFIELSAETVDTFGAIIAAREMHINARIIFHGVLKDMISTDEKERITSGGLKVGIRSGWGGAIDGIGRLLHQKYDRIEDFVNAGFRGVEAYDDILRLLSDESKGFEGGVWVGFNSKSMGSTSVHVREVGTVMEVDEMLVSESEELRMVGVRISAYDGYVRTKYLEVKAGTESTHEHSSSSEYDVEVPIGSGSPELSAMISSSTKDKLVYMNTVITIKGHMQLEVSGHADMKGVYLSAGSLEAFFDSLVLESLQDVIDEDSSSVNVGLNAKDWKSSAIGGLKQKRSAHIVHELTALIGEESAHIVVAKALELNGGMIGNAERGDDGRFTDHGELVLSVGELFVRHIHDYDEGYTLGASVKLMLQSGRGSEADGSEADGRNGRLGANSRNGNNGGGGKDALGIKPTVGGHSRSGHAYATIGKGDVQCKVGTGGGILGLQHGTCQLDAANRDVNHPQEMTTHYSVEPITGYWSNIDRDAMLKKLPHDDHGNIDWTTIAKDVGSSAVGEVGKAGAVFGKLLETFAATTGGKPDVNAQPQPQDVTPEEPTQKNEVNAEKFSTMDKAFEELDSKLQAEGLGSLKTSPERMTAIYLLAATLIKEGNDPKTAPQTALKYVMEAEKNGASYVKKTVAVVDDAAILAMAGITVTAICMSDPNCRQGVTDTLKSIGQFVADAVKSTVDKATNGVKDVANWLQNDDGGDKTDDNAEKDKIKQNIAGKSGGTANLDPDPDDGDDNHRKDDFKQYEKYKVKEGRYKCEKSESPVWNKLKPYQDKTKTNGLQGSDKRFYQWDNLHKEIEMYDKHGEPMDALDPITGKRFFKDVRHHKPIDV